MTVGITGPHVLVSSIANSPLGARWRTAKVCPQVIATINKAVSNLPTLHVYTQGAPAE